MNAPSNFERIDRGLCPNKECDGALVLESKEGIMHVYRCSECQQECYSTERLPKPEFVN